MAIDYSKFNKKIDIEGLKQDIQETETNGGTGDYRKVPIGNYEVKIEKMELTESQKGDPMVSIWFKILTGEYKNSLLFMNQVITQGFQLHIVNTFLKSLGSDIEVQFEDFEQYANLLMDIYENIDRKLEYGLEYGEKKGFNTFKITDIFEVE